MASQCHFVSHDKTVPAEVYTPRGGSKAGAIVVGYGSDGLTDNLNGPWASMIRDHSASLAKAGFIVVVPDYLCVTGTEPGMTAIAAIGAHRASWQAVISDAVDFATTLRLVDASRIGLLGYSLGAHLCLRIRSRAKVLVEFFGPLFDGIGPSGAISRVQIHHGQSDNVVPFDQNAEPIKQQLEREGTHTELFAYSGA